MDQKEWDACDHPNKMLDFLQGKGHDRKLWHFAAVCCRRVWHLLTDDRLRRAVDMAEAYADQGSPPQGWEVTVQDVNEAVPDDDLVYHTAEELAAWTVVAVINIDADTAAWDTAGLAASALAARSRRGLDQDAWNKARAAERRLQTHFLRDIFGPLPFRPLSPLPRPLGRGTTASS